MNTERWQAERDDEIRKQVEQRAVGVSYMSTSRRLSASDHEIVGKRLTEPELHYEFLPGLHKDEREYKGHFYWYWGQMPTTATCRSLTRDRMVGGQQGCASTA